MKIIPKKPQGFGTSKVCILLPHSCSCRESCLLELLIGSLGAGIKQPSQIRFLFRVLALVMFIGVGSVDVCGCLSAIAELHTQTHIHTPVLVITVTAISHSSQPAFGGIYSRV